MDVTVSNRSDHALDDTNDLGSRTGNSLRNVT
jgi:hypothetical protein